MLRATCLCVLLTAPAVGQPPKEPPYQVPTPKGWGRDTILLPPKFAPDMSWKGTEELRFAPGMFQADAPDFFSYALLFWLPDDQKIDARTMQKELLAYYRGLARAVSEGQKRDVDPTAFALTLQEATERPGKRPGGEEVAAHTAALTWTEPFVTGQPQTLRMEIHAWHSASHKHHCVFICASPRPETAEVWKTLREIRAGCTTP